MNKKQITTNQLETMSVSKFKNLTERYEKIKLVHPSFSLNYYIIKESQNVSHFKEKLELLITHFIEKWEDDKNELLGEFLNSACFFLQPEVVEYLLKKGIEVNKKEYNFVYDFPLFRTFFYNYYLLNKSKINTLQKENVIKIGKLLIQHGSLLEINVKDLGVTKNVIEIAREENLERFLPYIEEYQHLFNPVQQKQWRAMRLSTLF